MGWFRTGDKQNARAEDYSAQDIDTPLFEAAEPAAFAFVLPFGLTYNVYTSNQSSAPVIQVLFALAVLIVTYKAWQGVQKLKQSLREHYIEVRGLWLATLLGSNAALGVALSVVSKPFILANGKIALLGLGFLGLFLSLAVSLILTQDRVMERYS